MRSFAAIISLSIRKALIFLLLLSGAQCTLAQNGASLCIQTGHAASVNRLAYSHDAKLLASADEKATVLIWHLPTNGQMATIRVPVSKKNEAVTALFFSSDNKTLFIGTSEALFVWNIPTATFVYKDTIRGGVNTFGGCVEDPDKVWVAGNNLLLFNLKDRSFKNYPELTSIVNIYGQKSEYLFVNQYGSVCETDKNLKVNFVSKAVYPEKRFKRIRKHFGKQIKRANHKVSRRTSKLIYCEKKNRLSRTKKAAALLSRAQGQFDLVLKKMKTESRVADLCLNTEKNILYTVYKNKIRAIDFKNGKRVFVTSGTYNDDDFRSVTYVPSTQKLLAGSSDGCVYVLNAESGKIERKLRNHLGAVNASQLSPDGNVFASAGEDRSLILWGTNDHKMIKRLYSRAFPITCLSVSKDEKKIMYGNELGFVGMLERGTPQLTLKTIQAHSHPVRDLRYLPSTKLVLSGGDDNRLVLSNVNNHKIIKKKRFRVNLSANAFINNTLRWLGFYISPYCMVDSMRLSRNEKFVCVSGTRKNIMKPFYRKYVFYFDTEKLKRRSKPRSEWESSINKNVLNDSVIFGVAVYNPENGHSDRVSGYFLDTDNKELVTSSLDATLKIWDSQTKKLKLTVVPIDKNKKVLITPESYYYASRDALDAIGFRNGTDFFPAAAFDMTYNRPDKVLAALNFPNDLVEVYGLACLKRLQKAGLHNATLKSSFHIPMVKVTNKSMLSAINNEKYIKINVEASDSLFPLSLIRVQINGVTVVEVESGNTFFFSKTVQIKLSQGINQIRVTSVNTEGAESVAENLKINFAEKQKPDLYVIAIGVSEYNDKTKNLRYAVKDGKDLALAFHGLEKRKRKAMYNHIYIDTLFNQNATRENILFLKQKLQQSNVDDEVILYVSGHGLLDDSLDFYFATYDMDFAKPALQGIPYEELEALLNDIPARSKLMLMDACHSGELDRDELVKPTDTLTLEKLLNQQGSKGVSAVRKGRIGLTNSYELMQELFAGMSNRSGSVVISAATGYGYALEGEDWNNGAFTHCLLKGLTGKSADQNDDGKITVSELRKYVLEEVPVLTGGRQKPTCRQDNLLFDFRVW
ncbi:MAG: caspase family protein [Bacteroidota bacterium]